MFRLHRLALVAGDQFLEFFAYHAFFSKALFYHICRPYATPHFQEPDIVRVSTRAAAGEAALVVAFLGFVVFVT